MVANVELVDPRKIQPNSDNPRLIFRIDELSALEESIRHQGILVPLSVYRDRSHFTLLDGERRWRCAIKLGLSRVPSIIQDKPDRVTNIMMMFAIHNARRDWDPLPTALKLQELEGELSKGLGRNPTEGELAAAASISRGEVRRYRKILAVPERLRAELLLELEKPRQDQMLTVDHVLETMSGVAQLRKRGVIDEPVSRSVTKAVIAKFRSGTLRSTTEPRKFSRIARSFERNEVDREAVRDSLSRLVHENKYTIDDVFKDTVEQYDFEHSTEQLAQRLVVRLDEMKRYKSIRSNELKEALKMLKNRINKMI